MMTDRQVNALAAFIADGCEWDAPGVVAALRAEREHYDCWQLAQAMIRRAADPRNLAPRLQPFDHDAKPMTCRKHPSAGVRTDGTCGGCYADRVEAPAPVRRRDPSADPHPLESALQRVAR